MVVTPVVKPVSTRCNLRCIYCYHWGQQKHLSVRGKRMEPDLLRSLIGQVFACSPRLARFIWHGGEPLLAGLPFFEEAVRIQKSLANGKPVVNSIQTNGTLINEQWASFFAREKWRVGVSLDGPREIHNANRVTATGKGSFEMTMQGISVLRGHGLEPGLGAVVTRASLGREEGIFEFFRNLGLNFDLSPYILGPDPTDKAKAVAITPQEFAGFVCKVFDFWWTLDNPNLKVRILGNGVQAALGRTPKLCSLSGNCDHFVGVDSNGDVYPCGRFLRRPEVLFGNLKESDLTEILEGDRYRGYTRKANSLSKGCEECPWFYACHGGCTYERYKEGGAFRSRTSLCSAYKAIYAHVTAKVKVTKAALELNKLAKST